MPPKKSKKVVKSVSFKKPKGRPAATAPQSADAWDEMISSMSPLATELAPPAGSFEDMITNIQAPTAEEVRRAADRALIRDMPASADRTRDRGTDALLPVNTFPVRINPNADRPTSTTVDPSWRPLSGLGYGGGNGDEKTKALLTPAEEARLIAHERSGVNDDHIIDEIVMNITGDDPEGLEIALPKGKGYGGGKGDKKGKKDKKDTPAKAQITRYFKGKNAPKSLMERMKEMMAARDRGELDGNFNIPRVPKGESDTDVDEYDSEEERQYAREARERPATPPPAAGAGDEDLSDTIPAEEDSDTADTVMDGAGTGASTLSKREKDKEKDRRAKREFIKDYIKQTNETNKEKIENAWMASQDKTTGGADRRVPDRPARPVRRPRPVGEPFAFQFPQMDLPINLDADDGAPVLAPVRRTPEYTGDFEEKRPDDDDDWGMDGEDIRQGRRDFTQRTRAAADQRRRMEEASGEEKSGGSFIRSHTVRPFFAMN